MLRIKNQNLEKIELFQLLLFMLILMNEIPKIYVFTSMSFLNSILNYMQIPIYAGLLYIIIKKRYSPRLLAIFAFLGILSAVDKLLFLKVYYLYWQQKIYLIKK